MNLVGRREGKRTLGRLRCRNLDKIKIYLQKVGLGGRGEWTGLNWFRIGTGGRLL